MGDGHDTVDGRFRNPARKPVDMVSISHYYKVLYCTRWCRISSINSMSFFWELKVVVLPG